MPGLNADQLNEVTYISGVDADGKIATNSYAVWTQHDNYDAFPYTAKWGGGLAGEGASVTVSFDAGSHWSATEQAVLTAAMHLWTAVANINFSVVNDGSGDVVVSRGSDGEAAGGINRLEPGQAGTVLLGTADTGIISIDTSVAGFGPIDGSFETAGGYAWHTAVHEWGHVLGLGHAGAYNGTAPLADFERSYDNRAWSVMSYLDPKNNDAFFVEPTGGVQWGFVGGTALGPAFNREPTTWMPLDILAAQRLYGVATNSPLSSGGQIFGFHSNIAGDIHNFFDFTVNQTPVITIWDGGAHNMLDVSGFNQDATVSLDPGSFSSVAGLTNNVAIAFGTRIESAIGGAGNDTIHANDLNDVLMGGTGGDSLIGGAGNDHIYGNMATAVAGTSDGADYIDVGGGMNYANGNAGNDTIVAGDGPNRLFGGQGDDHISAGNGADSINGNLGNDVITVGNGRDTIHGGQGDDVIHVGSGNDQIFGDLGNDTLFAGTGHDVLTGGGGADLFVFAAGSSAIEEVTDFSASAGDRLNIGAAVSADHVLHDAGTNFSSEALAAQTATSLVGAQSGVIAALQVGSDTYLFVNGGGIGEIVHLDGIDASSIDAGCFAFA